MESLDTPSSFSSVQFMAFNKEQTLNYNVWEDSSKLIIPYLPYTIFNQSAQ